MPNSAGRNGSRGRLGSGRFKITKGDPDPFWRKDEARGANGEGPDGAPLSFETPEDISDWIAKRAYEIYEERGRGDGDDQADWFKAETEIIELVKRERLQEAADEPADHISEEEAVRTHDATTSEAEATKSAD